MAQALEPLPGVNIDFSGGRNETGLRVRGYDARQVPLFLDGIPQYVPLRRLCGLRPLPHPRPLLNPRGQKRCLADVRPQHFGRRHQPGYAQTGQTVRRRHQCRLRRHRRPQLIRQLRLQHRPLLCSGRFCLFGFRPFPPAAPFPRPQTPAHRHRLLPRKRRPHRPPLLAQTRPHS
ncbi:Plug domain-containing protein [Eikenella halliae]|uniref:Plug domain-containing protein n=1 Tax=Eikenella halliae TaxID=1795832 RepID=UPI0039648203